MLYLYGVSTEEQTEYSPDSQLKAVRKYAKEHDMILPDEFVFMDEGISGRTAGKRPEFQRMIGTAKLKPKPFDVILLRCGGNSLQGLIFCAFSYIFVVFGGRNTDISCGCFQNAHLLV